MNSDDNIELNSNDHDITSIAIRCIGTKIKSDTEFKGKGSGGFFKTVRSLTGSKQPIKNDRRVLRLYHSSPFNTKESKNHHDNELDESKYKFFYQSEYFEKDPDICPSLLANINCPHDKNMIILVYVFYSSNLTSNQEVMICNCLFSLDELRTTVTTGGIFKIPMTSEYCKVAISYLEIISSFKPIIVTKELSVMAPKKLNNPMEQSYVFYEEVSDGKYVTTSPVVDVKEISSEPSQALTIPIKFLETFNESILRSMEAWKYRYQLERIRQGRFTSSTEASQYNWRQIKVKVIEAKIRYSDINPTNSNITFIPVGIDDESKSARVSTYKKGGFMGPKINEKEPNSFVEMVVQDESELYSYNVGRTNTEYHMLDPIYGCNLNTSVYRKEAMDPIPDDAGHVTKSFKKSALFIVMEDLVNREMIREAINSSRESIDNDRKYANQKLVQPLTDTEFTRHIPNTEQAKIIFNVYFASKHTDQILQGSAEIALNTIGNNGSVDKWITLKLVNNCTCSSIKVHVQVSLAMDETLVDNSLHVPYTMADTLVYDNNSSLDGALYKTECNKMDCTDVIPRCYEWMWMLGFQGIDPFVDRSTCQSGIMNKRLDYQYPLHWMNETILKLSTIHSEIETMISSISENAVASNKTHRCSKLKTDMEWQAVPINLHYQFFLVRRHLAGEINNKYEVLDTVTCGATSAHGLGQKEGGLRKALRHVSGLRQIVDGSFNYCAKLQDNIVNMKGQSLLEAAIHKNKYMELEMGPNFLELETNCLNLATRYCYCFSQCISIALNGLLMKLSLLAEGKIPEEKGIRWLECGFLIIFQSLLSVSGKEKSMIEDTAEVVRNLNHTLIRIVPSTDTKITDISFSGREVTLQMSLSVIDKLPEVYRNRIKENGVINMNLVSALFTQGIDINQYIATTTTNGENGAANIQIKINKMEGFPALNKYCYSVKHDNIDPNDMKPHSMLLNLHKHLGTTGVDVLKEVEDICIALGGCMVTFCKSGKDRTGMVMTLQQSRFLSQYCGDSEQRVLKDANLMRIYGTRLDIAEKNTGRRAFAINQIQVNFLPPSLRPPTEVLEKIMTKDQS